MKAKRIRIIPEPCTTPMCEAVRANKYANDTPTTDKSCKHHSSYVLDGHYYCARHAGVVALKHYMGEHADDNDAV